ncbi:hypothetical protein CPB86DRAFT_317111 [Serendipita vermifera]|nr:hypothetical protein CPB86DRAFT_317111 [Serendipita vermifera]
MQLCTRFLAAALSISAVFAQSSNYTAADLTAALNGAGLTALAGVLGSAPPELIGALQQGNHTVFAPSNEALASIDPAALGDITSTLKYHVAAGAVDESSLANKTTVVRTSLTGAPLVLLRESGVL